MSGEDALRILALVSARVAVGHLDDRQLAEVVEALRPYAAPSALPADAQASSGAQLALAGAGPLAPATPPPSGRDRLAVRDAAMRVFVYWRAALEHPGAKPTRDRLAKIEARLREGYSEADLRAAIDGCAASDFHRGANDRGQAYDGIGLIMRNGEHVERFAAMAPHLGADVSPAIAHGADREQRLRERMAEQLRKGDRDGYERTNAKLARLRADAAR